MKTLVLDLDDVLVHSDWSRERGWRTFKRPGAEDFLRTMSQYYEVGIRSDEARAGEVVNPELGERIRFRGTGTEVA